MAETPVVSALVERRARVAGELRKMQLRVMALRADLSAIDASLRMFKEDYRPLEIEAKPTLEKNPAGLPKGTGAARRWTYCGPVAKRSRGRNSRGVS